MYDRWSKLPGRRSAAAPRRRGEPRLVRGETAFSGEYDLRNRTAGAVFAGPPNFNTLYREFVDGRDAGTPEVEPVYRGGRTVRFTLDPRSDIPPAAAPWDGPRVLYLKHASDPIIWWSPRLVLQAPDWLREPPGRTSSAPCAGSPS